MFDIIHSCQEYNIDSLILLVDFEKAFDSLSWEYIKNSLKELNFGEILLNGYQFSKNLQTQE